MSGYKRNVEYLYDFNDGIRKNSVGFARTECINGECKLTVHITAPNLGNKTLRVSFYRNNKNKLQQFFIGEVGTRNGSGNYRSNVNAAQLEQNGWNLEEVDGVLVYVSDDRYFVASEAPLNMRSMEDKQTNEQDAPPDIQNTSQVPIHQEVKMQEQVEWIEPRTEKPWNPVTEMRTEENQENERIDTPIDNIRRKEKLRIPEVDVPRMNPEEQNVDLYVPKDNTIDTLPRYPTREIEENEPSNRKAPDQNNTVDVNGITLAGQDGNVGVHDETQPCSREEYMEPQRAQRAFQCCPHVYPFEDNEMMECVKLELADIGLLPMDQWSISHNSFLLHSFYLYGHMLLAKKQGRCGFQYFLMVPGVYQNKEKNIASRFGFHSFKCARKREQRQGEFGYWYLPVIYQSVG